MDPRRCPGKGGSARDEIINEKEPDFFPSEYPVLENPEERVKAGEVLRDVERILGKLPVEAVFSGQAFRIRTRKGEERKERPIETFRIKPGGLESRVVAPSERTALALWNRNHGERMEFQKFQFQFRSHPVKEFSGESPRTLFPGPDQNPGRTEGEVKWKTVFDSLAPEVERFGVRTDAGPARLTEGEKGGEAASRTEKGREGVHGPNRLQEVNRVSSALVMVRVSGAEGERPVKLLGQHEPCKLV